MVTNSIISSESSKIVINQDKNLNQYCVAVSETINSLTWFIDGAQLFDAEEQPIVSECVEITLTEPENHILSVNVVTANGNTLNQSINIYK